jgi:hypothetical protein
VVASVRVMRWREKARPQKICGVENERRGARAWDIGHQSSRGPRSFRQQFRTLGRVGVSAAQKKREMREQAGVNESNTRPAHHMGAQRALQLWRFDPDF